MYPYRFKKLLLSFLVLQTCLILGSEIPGRAEEIETGRAVYSGENYALVFGNTFDEMAYGIDVDSDGNVYATGSFSGPVDFDPSPGTNVLQSHQFNYDAFLAKFDSGGELVWAYGWGNDDLDKGCDVDVDPLGNVYVAGSFIYTIDFDPGDGEDFQGADDGSNRAFLSSFTSDGEYQWTRTWEVSEFEGVYRIDTDDRGRVYIAGVFESATDFDPGPGVDEQTPVSDTGSYITVFNSEGDFEWARTWGGDGGWGNNAHDVKVNNTGDILVVGSFAGDGDLDPGPDEELFENENEWGSVSYIMCLDPEGEFKWSETWSSGEGQFINLYELDIDAEDNICMTGYFNGSIYFDPGDNSVELTSETTSQFISKLTPDGQYLWAYGWPRGGGAMGTFGPSIAVDINNDILVAGDFGGTTDFDPGEGVAELTTSGDGTDAFAAKFSSDGSFLWAARVGGECGYQGDLLMSVKSDQLGNVYLSGAISGTADIDPGPGVSEVMSLGYRDILILKLNPDGEF